MSLRIRIIRKRSTFCFMLTFFPMILSQCPESTNTLRRIGKTRYYIIHNTQHRGDFVTIDQARQDCSKHGLKLATVKNLLSLAVVGRPLEKMAFKERMKDTWYWLDAKYDTKSEKYHWRTDVKDELKYTMILYRTPRLIGVSSHINYNNVYQGPGQTSVSHTSSSLAWECRSSLKYNRLFTELNQIVHCTLSGHQTSFDERDCNSQQKRHAMCEASNKDCQLIESNPFVLDEEKQDYFEEGNWIFGDRKYIVNWKQKTFNDSERYCKSLGLQLMNAGDLEKFLIPHIKMWSREVTVSQFWTGMSYHDETKQYMDSSGNIIADENSENNFTESEFQSRSSKNSPVFCVALSLAYEFRSQMPCSNNGSTGCQWSFIRYAPANCNNYHGTICQHPDYDEREVKWYPNFKTNLDDVLQKTALTTVFGYKGYNFVLRSKYKQTFGVCYCPKGYRMIRSHRNTNLAWSVKPANTTGKNIHEYDYLESYWMVDKDSYNKDANSKCTLSYTDKGTRKFKEIKCTDWYFYLCEKLGKRPTKPLDININKAPPMKWEEGPQPRVYPLISAKNSSIYERLCPCKIENDDNEWNAVTNECVKRSKECPRKAFDHDHCQRQGPHAFYSIGGVICSNPKKNDKCTFEKIIYASDFLPERPRHQDAKGIFYETDTELNKRWNVPLEQWRRLYTPSIRFIPVRDYTLYLDAYQGNVLSLPSVNKTEKDGCATLFFNIIGDGRYEISIKFLDQKNIYKRVYKRVFNILLNDMFIAREFNPNVYRPEKSGVELNVNFRIFEKGRMLELQGHPSKVLQGDQLKLEMCYSFCARIGYKADPNWLMNAVSILKFSSKPDDPCECKVKVASKEYNTVFNQCADKIEGGCYYSHFTDHNQKFCQRTFTHIFYAYFGNVCNSWLPGSASNGPYCNIKRTIYAVNIGGQPHTDERGILHAKLNRSDWQVKPHLWVEGPSRINVTNVPTNDNMIYKTWASGAWTKLNQTRSVDLGCAVLLFQTYGDGYYEISMKTGELYWKASENLRRTFSVILNGIYFVKEFTIERYRKSPIGMELVANFKISENSKMLQLQGHPTKEIERSDKKLELEICHSNCVSSVVGFTLDRSWVLYGLSIVKFDVEL